MIHQNIQTQHQAMPVTSSAAYAKCGQLCQSASGAACSYCFVMLSSSSAAEGDLGCAGAALFPDAPEREFRLLGAKI